MRDSRTDATSKGEQRLSEGAGSFTVRKSETDETSRERAETTPSSDESEFNSAAEKGFEDIRLMGARNLMGYSAFGLWLAWFWLAFGNGTFNPGSDELTTYAVCFTLVAAGCTFLLIAWQSKRSGPRKLRQVLPIVMGCLGTLCSAVISFSTAAIAIPQWLVFTALVIVGPIAAYLLFRCFCRYRRCSFNQAVMLTFGALFMMFFAYFSAVTIPLEGSSALFSLMPLAIALLLKEKQSPREEDQEAGNRPVVDEHTRAASPESPALTIPSRGTRFTIIAGFSIFFATISFVRGSGIRFENGPSLLSIGSSGVVVALAIVAIVVIYLHLRGTSIAMLLRGCYIYAALGTSFAVATITVTGAGNFAVRSLTSMAYLLLFIVLWCCMLARMNVYGDAPAKAIGAALGTVSLSAGIGWGVRGLMALLYPSQNAPMTLLIGLGFLDLAFFLFGFSDTALMAYVTGDKASSEHRKHETDSEPYRMPFKEACSQIGAEAGLTPRELEVFILLAKGRDTEHIAEDLVVSYYTVRAHVRNIYEKLGVHSKQEMLDMIDTRRNAPFAEENDQENKAADRRK